TEIHTEFLGAREPEYLPVPLTEVSRQDDANVLRKARAARNGEKFIRLWGGDWSQYKSPSEADLALVALLAHRSDDPVQIDRLFRRSGLMRPKWDEKSGTKGTYGKRTIGKALRTTVRAKIAALRLDARDLPKTQRAVFLVICDIAEET